MDKQLMYVRVMEKDLADQIRIGATFPIWRNALEEKAKNIRDTYERNLEWCGGFDKGCRKYYTRIALVEADSLAIVRDIWNSGKGGE